MTKLLSIALGGALGALARHGIGVLAMQTVGEERFPWGTFTVNALGSFLLGLALEAFLHTDALSPNARVMWTTGFLGAFTTFSTYSVQSLRLLERGDTAMAIANILANVVVGLGLAAAGVATARALTAAG